MKNTYWTYRESILNSHYIVGIATTNEHKHAYEDKGYLQATREDAAHILTYRYSPLKDRSCAIEIDGKPYTKPCINVQKFLRSLQPKKSK